MAGFEPARACSAQRILSPLRLPFRHIGICIGNGASLPYSYHEISHSHSEVVPNTEKTGEKLALR
jgi:hypothetical protein